MAATIFNYCERGRDASFWAEPLNAVTNGAFILAALFCLIYTVRRPLREQTADVYLMVLLLIAIGIGSFLFHTYATAWAASADTIPIGIFIVIYTMFAFVRFVGMGPGVATVATGSIIGAAVLILQNARCNADWAMRYNGGPGVCLNGSVGYMPAFGLLILTGLWLWLRRHPAAWHLMGAGVVFGISLTLRTLDPALCGMTEVMGQRIGTHWAWHVLNATTLLILVIAAIDHWRHTGDMGNVIGPTRRARA